MQTNSSVGATAADAAAGLPPLTSSAFSTNPTSEAIITMADLASLLSPHDRGPKPVG